MLLVTVGILSLRHLEKRSFINRGLHEGVGFRSHNEDSMARIFHAASRRLSGRLSFRSEVNLLQY